MRSGPPADRRRAIAATIAGAVVLLLVTAIDVVGAGELVVITGVALGPVVAMLAATPRAVAVLGLAALASAAVSGTWNGNLGELDWLLRLLWVAGATGAALVAATAREREAAVRRQQAAVLGGLAEAVTVQDPAGRLVFANQAAADALGVAAPEAVVGTTWHAQVERFEICGEDGTLLGPEDLPARRLLAGEDAAEPVLVRVRDRRDTEERWYTVKASAVRDAAGGVRYAVTVADDVTAVKRAEVAQRLLSEAGRVLASSLDVRATMQRLASVVVPELADWCLVHVPREDGLMELLGVAHADPARLAAVREVAGRHPTHIDEEADVARVARLGEVRLIPEVPPAALAAARDDEHRAVLEGAGTGSVMMVPLEAAGRPLGALTLVNSVRSPVFGPAELELAREIARRAGVALANAQLYEERARTAQTLQQELLPPDLPELPGWTTAALYRAAGEVGGDFYDVWETEDGWMVVIGDVAGRGPSAAALTSLARYTLRTAGTLTADARAAIALLNRALVERPTLSLVSVCLVHVRDRAGEPELQVLCAGHPPPFTVRDGRPEQVAAGGALLGAMPDAAWESRTLRLAPGELLVLYTDGVIDATNGVERFGEHRLRQALEGAAAPAAAVEQVRAAIDAFAAADRHDDTAVLVLSRLPLPDRRLDLPRGPAAPRDARRAVEAWLRGSVDAECLEEVKLLVSELVTNGVRHVAGHRGDSVGLHVRVRPELIRVEVRDPGSDFVPGPAVVPPLESLGGRGLLIVDRVASRWGVAPGPTTCVWFELDRELGGRQPKKTSAVS